MNVKMRNRRIDIEKASILSLVMNLCEVVVLAVLLVWLLTGFRYADVLLLKELLAGVIILLIVEGLLSARDALAWRETGRNFEMLKEAQDSLNELNLQLRKQRHDFLNQLQVVYSLVDLNEKEEAIRYMEEIYGQMHHLSQGMKTELPVVNALLSAKLADCEQKGIRCTLQVESALHHLPMSDWEFCRILGNLADNAMDAVSGTDGGEITLYLGEDLRSIRVRVSNNGPAIPPSAWDRIFSAGYTTKKSGQGLGLSIVRELTEKTGGQVSVTSDSARTVFECVSPKEKQKEEESE